MYSGEYDACDVTLSVYPHRASLKNMSDHGGNINQLLHYFACVMPRLTRNSRESGPVFSGVVSSEQSTSESRTSIGATSGASMTTNTVVQSGTSTMPALSTGDIVTNGNVVQVLQGQLTSLVQNAIDAQLSSSASGSSGANSKVSSQAQLSTATSRTASFVHNLATSAGNFSTLGSAPF